MAPPLQSLQRACGGCQEAMLQELLAPLRCPEGLLESGRQGQGPLPGESTIMSPGTVMAQGKNELWVLSPGASSAQSAHHGGSVLE